VLDGVRASSATEPFYDRERFELLQSWFRVIDECRDRAYRDEMRAALLRWKEAPGSERKSTRQAFNALVDGDTKERHVTEELMRWRSDFMRWLGDLPVPLEEPPPWAADVEQWRVGREPWALDPKLVKEALRILRSGFWEPARVPSILCKETHPPGEIEPWVALAAVATAVEVLREEQRSWPAETDCDRLERAFAWLREHGIIALQNAGYTQSDGYEDVREAHACAPDGIIGYCFFHGQDLESAIESGGLTLAFGPIDPREEQGQGLEIARRIVSALEANGLQTQWNGSFERRIEVTPFEWRKRGPL